ncbi:MAG: hypothetical protein B6D41_21165 [Chloroflexi bacterium UTCFX4]|jgi:hypothetical protein|nr:MAG: hypothetical protein B6D41_21165 [Chloroflexi bacterium UTCFX4]
MTTHELRAYLDRLVISLEPRDQKLLQARLNGLVSVFPFNEYEYILTFLVDRRALSFREYEKLRANYVSSNRYLDLFGLAPRVFGQIWGEQHLQDIDPRFQKPTRTLDPNYVGQYDLWLDGARVEVKAARAIHTKQRGAVSSKALRRDSLEPFWMNFQQLKFDVCDAFVFIGVWVDEIVYWVLSHDQVKSNLYLSHQHRGGVEYQIGITHKNILAFEAYQVAPQELANVVIEKSK